jgi:hypothetical protein
MTIEEICEFAKFGLEQQAVDSKFSENKIKVKSVHLHNISTLVCQFYPYAISSIDIRQEAVYIIAFLFSFFNENPYAPEGLAYFAVQGYDSNDNELMYVVSSVSSARSAAKGNTLEWLQNSKFQDNSEDFRLISAKRKISEIENALRKLIVKVLNFNHGSNWWSNVVNRDIRSDAEKAFKNQNGVNSSIGEKLISYTYLSQLKKICSDQWINFSLVFPSKSDFGNWMSTLNIIRRDEGHNRPITNANLEKLTKIHESIMGHIATLHPELVNDYRIENWRNQLIEISKDYSDNFSFPEKVSGNDLLEEIVRIESNINKTKNTITKLKSITPPFGKEDLHEKLIKTYDDLNQSFIQIVTTVKSGKYQNLEAAILSNATARNKMSEFLQEYLFSEL